MKSTRRVLLVEPDPDLRALLEQLLAEEGLHVIVCTSLVDVLGRAECVSGELALVDLWGNRGAALGSAEQEGLRRVGALVPLVLIAGGAWARTGQPEQVGAVALLPKPFSLQELLSVLGPGDVRIPAAGAQHDRVVVSAA